MSFNYDMLSLARESRYLTQVELAKKTSMSQGKLSKIEHGLLQPNEDDIKTFSAILYYPEDFFYQTAMLQGFPPYHHRKRQKLKSKVLGFLHAEINKRLLQLTKLISNIDFNVDKTIPQYDPLDFDDDVEEIARIVREYWALPKGPVRNIVQAIENAGGIIMLCNFETKELDALSRKIAGLAPVFFVNKNMTSDRMRFTLAHELGHLVLHTIPDDDKKMEEQADRFAAAFLMPKNQICHQLRNITLEKLASLKLYWGTSMAALLYRAFALKTITERQYKYLWSQMMKAGYKYQEPHEVPKEKPTLLKELIDIYMKEFKYSVEELSALFCIYPDEFNAIYLEKSILKIVV